MTVMERVQSMKTNLQSHFFNDFVASYYLTQDRLSMVISVVLCMYVCTYLYQMNENTSHNVTTNTHITRVKGLIGPVHTKVHNELYQPETINTQN